MSQGDLAERLNVSRQSVSKWETGQAVPELDKIIKLSELFGVTTDYLLKDNTPDDPPPPEPEPQPEPVPAPEPPAKAPRKIWPWVLAAIAAIPIVLIITVLLFRFKTGSGAVTVEGETAIYALPTPEAADGEWTIQVASTDQAYEGPQMETYTFGKEQTALEGGPVTPEEMTAIAKEYEPFGVTYDAKTDQWYYNGEAVRVFTDIMISNGQPPEGGNFRGVMRSFAGTGTIDIRTVRDYGNPDADGNGTLTGIEKYDVSSDALWEETP